MTSKTIYNYRPPNTPLSSSEYILANRDKKLNLTKTHGMGSGIYGLTEPNNPNRKYEIQESINLNNPVIITTNDDNKDFITLSRYLMYYAEWQINYRKHSDKEYKYSSLEYNFLKTYKKADIEEIKSRLAPEVEISIDDAVNNFRENYLKHENQGELIEQPINYLLKDKYDGVYNQSPNGNTFSVGSVKYKKILPRDQKYAFKSLMQTTSHNKTLINPSIRSQSRGRSRSQTRNQSRSRSRSRSRSQTRNQSRSRSRTRSRGGKKNKKTYKKNIKN
jgi:hypothetical protein